MALRIKRWRSHRWPWHYLDLDDTWVETNIKYAAYEALDCSPQHLREMILRAMVVDRDQMRNMMGGPRYWAYLMMLRRVREIRFPIYRERRRSHRVHIKYIGLDLIKRLRPTGA